MNNGKSIVELAKELERRAGAKRDFVADTKQITMVPAGNDVRISVGGHDFGVTSLTHKQLGTHVGIPAQYYGKMQADSPALLATNVNHWLHGHDISVRRMVRTLDGDARAFLSDRYRRIENEQIATAVLPALMESPEIKIESTDITETRLYIKALFPRIQGEVKKGDVVQAGIVISNSEVGMGSLNVQPLVYRLVCTNGLIADGADAFGLKKHHIGRRASTDENYAIYRSETIQAEDRALMMKLQDAVRAAAKGVAFQELLRKMQEAATGIRIQSPMKAVEELGKVYDLNEGERGSVLENLIRNQDMTRWGALNAITELANVHESYERSTELEIIGGQMLDLPRTHWERIAEAA